MATIAPPSGIGSYVPLLNMITGYWTSRSIATAVELGIPDALGDQGVPIDKLVAKLGLNAGATLRYLRGLQGIGIVTESQKEVFKLTPLGSLLRSDVPGSLNGLAKYFNEPWQYAAWKLLGFSVKTGTPGFEKEHGLSFGQYLAANPDAAGLFNDALFELAKLRVPAVVANYDFATVTKLVDLGGRGDLLHMIQGYYPRLQGEVYNLPDALSNTADGDGIPDADTYLLANVACGQPDQSVNRIYNMVGEKGVGTKALVMELFRTEAAEDAFAKVLDIQMLVMGNGLVRSEAQHTALLQSAGFKVDKVIRTELPVGIIEATYQG